jgi:tetratricopeptide (TPR) repeat protein
MIYYILPPIIIIISIAALIFFLFKKVSIYPNQEILRQNLESPKDESFINKIPAILKQLILRILEKTIQRLKLLALKFHNISNEWGRLIRKKRQQDELSLSQRESEMELFEKKEIIQEDLTRPMIKSTVVHPDNRSKSSSQKNHLEEILIKRIAINPRDIEAYERLGDYYNEQTNLKDALECYKQVLKLSPSHYKAKSKIRRIEKII